MTRRAVSVLVVDDDVDHRRLLARCLSDAGMTVTTAASGQEALERLDGVDLVLLDYRLPGMSGLETLRAIRGVDGPSVVMVTGMGSEGLAVEAMRAGAIDYLVKEPHYLALVPERVQRAWRHHDLSRRTAALQRLALLVTSAEDADEVFAEIVGGARALLAADACALALRVGADIELVARVGGWESDADELVHAAGALLSHATPAPPGSGVLLVPLPSLAGEPLGALAILDASASDRSEDDLRLAEAFASFAGLALQNLRRFESERSFAAELAARAGQQAAVARLGQRALAEVDAAQLFDEAAVLVQTVLGVDYVSVLELLPDRETLLFHGGAGWTSPPTDRLVTGRSTWSQARQTLATSAPVVVADLAAQPAFDPPPLLRAHAVASSATVAIPGPGAPFGVLAVDSVARREFSTQDVDFLQSVAHVLAAAISSKRAKRDLAHQALHDPLTGLPNRALLLDRMEQALARRRPGGALAVLFVDVDRFKVVNDSLGHSVGDDLLVAVGSRFCDVVRPSDTVARFGGDEFVVLSELPGGDEGAIELAERLTRAVREPIAVGGRRIQVAVSIGVVVAGPDDDAESLLRDADAAMYRAKERGRSRHELFDQSMRRRLLERLETESALRHGIDHGQLRVHFQPEVSLTDGRLVGVEALVRWQHPERGLLLPGDFLPMAEETGLSVALGHWVLREACRQVAGRPDLADVQLWVNLSARELTQPGLTSVVARTMAETGMRPDRLGVEITEAVMMEDVDAVGRALGELRDLGLQLAIDDFGTGFSSLTYLRRFPVSALKIDRSFVAGLLEDGEDAAIVRAVAGLGRSLGLSVVAEGVEDAAQAAALAALGCDLAQGWHFGRPQELARLDVRAAGSGRGETRVAALG